MNTIRGLSGFGDAIYLLAVVQQLFSKEDIVILNDYRDVFKGYKTEIYNRVADVDYDFSYLNRKTIKHTNQWQDTLLNAGIEKDIGFRINTENLEIRKDSPELIIVNVYPAFGNGAGSNGFITPYTNDFSGYVFKVKDNYNSTKTIDDKIDFTELCNLFFNAKKVVCQQGWGTALAEALNIPCNVIFTKRALECGNNFINSITPDKIFTKKTSKAVILP